MLPFHPLLYTYAKACYMPKSKKKKVTVKNIADAVAEIHGLKKGFTKAIVESVFDEMLKQFIETGHLVMPHLGNMNVSISIRSGTAKSFFTFKPTRDLKKWLDTLPKDPKNAPILEYILERDGDKLEKYENARLCKLAKIKMWRAQSHAYEQVRIAKFLAEKQGIVIDPKQIGPEYLTPPRDHNARLPDHRVTVREMLAKSGGLPLQKPVDQSNPEENSPLESPPDSNSPS